eukprot:3248096-Amphidinium_carterae.1
MACGEVPATYAHHSSRNAPRVVPKKARVQVGLVKVVRFAVVTTLARAKWVRSAVTVTFALLVVSSTLLAC